MSSSSVSPIDAFNERLRTICHQRSVDPTLLMPTILPQTDANSPASCLCKVCGMMMKTDSKTVCRHVLTDAHIQKVAGLLRIHHTYLLPVSISCRWCEQGFSGNRKDSLKRHEEVCTMKTVTRAHDSSWSYTTNDIPDNVTRVVPMRRSASLPIPATARPSSSHPQHPAFYANAPKVQRSTSVFPEPLYACDFI